MDIERNQTGGRVRRGNNFCKCCLAFISLLRYIPFIMISTFYGWGIFVYFYYSISDYDSIAVRVVIAVFFLPLYVLSYSSYFVTIFTKHRKIPNEFELPNSINYDDLTYEEINQALEQTILNRQLEINTRTFGGLVRYCRKCHVIKPDRCHHCSVCDQCIRKMDHHCHWVSNCVGYDNYKFFIQFLCYTILLTLYTSLTSLPQFMRFWQEDTFPGKFHIFFLVVFCLVFSLSIIFLLSYHIYLLLKNQTTIESYQPPRFKNFEYDYSRFNLGGSKNFREVFGCNKLYWFIPLGEPYNEKDGIYFKLPLCPVAFDNNKSGSRQNSCTALNNEITNNVSHVHSHEPVQC